MDARHPQLSDAERLDIATQIAIGALRYFMLKFTKNSVIAFDFKEALSFEGETGPYAQYAVVRATNIFRKGWTRSRHLQPKHRRRFHRILDRQDSDEIWELWLAAAKTSYVIDQCIATTEPAYLAKHASNSRSYSTLSITAIPSLLKQMIGRKQFLLATAAVVRRELIRVLAVMGITVPSVM